MSDKIKEISYKTIVLDFDKWLKDSPGRLLEKEGLIVLKEICRKWTDLKMEYINFMMSKCNALTNLAKNIKIKSEDKT